MTSARRSAMTLVEVVLALCLLVVLASITWPALDRPLADHRLRKAADGVRVEWSRARIKAMSSGETQVFRFAPETNRYAIESQAGFEYVGDSDDKSAQLASDSEKTNAVSTSERTLPDKILFVSAEITEDTRSQSICVGTENLSDAENGWSDPVQFYPDGTTSTATVTLRNEFDRVIELSLRGITGLATVGKVKNGEESVP